MRVLLLSLCLGVRLMAAEAEAVPLTYEQLELTDGRKLKKVVVKSYDGGAEKFVLFADGKFTSLSSALVPEPLRTKLKAAAPAAGGSTSSTPVRTVYPTVVVKGPDNIPKVYRPKAMTPEETVKVHKSVALRTATLRYSYNYPVQPGTSKVTPSKFELEEPKPVKGWIGRYSTRGRVYIEFFDASGVKSGGKTSVFEVVTETDSGESPRILDFKILP